MSERGEVVSLLLYTAVVSIFASGIAHFNWDIPIYQSDLNQCGYVCQSSQTRVEVDHDYVTCYCEKFTTSLARTKESKDVH